MRFFDNLDHLRLVRHAGGERITADAAQGGGEAYQLSRVKTLVEKKQRLVLAQRCGHGLPGGGVQRAAQIQAA